MPAFSRKKPLLCRFTPLHRPTDLMMSRAKDMLIVTLALSSGVLAVIAWRQQTQIDRLTVVRDGGGTGNGTVTVRHGSQRSFAVSSSSAAARRSAAERDSSLLGHDVGPVQERSSATNARRSSALVRLMENPEFVQALGIQRQATLDTRFGELFRKLNLESHELAEFRNLLVEKENVALDVVTVSETAPEGPLSPATFRASVRAAQAQVEQAIHSSLGSERYAVYREYERTLPQRATVAQLEQRLSYSGAPLTAAQSDAMVRILSSNAPATPAETAPVTSVVVRAGVPEAVPILPTNAATGRVTDEVVVQAQTILEPVQIHALREVQAEQQAALRTAQLIREALPVVEEMPGWGLMLLQ
jgi:hypothetical protein